MEESSWQQFVDVKDENGIKCLYGIPNVSSDNSIGIMQTTNKPSLNQEKIKTRTVYNIEQGINLKVYVIDKAENSRPYRVVTVKKVIY